MQLPSPAKFGIHIQRMIFAIQNAESSAWQLWLVCSLITHPGLNYAKLGLSRGEKGPIFGTARK
jgi:hypothetical protein